MGDFTVILTSHAQVQLDELGPRAWGVLEWLESLDLHDIEWMAESLPPQKGRDMFLLWAEGVRILFDIEDSDLTVHGVGLRPTGGRRREYR